MKRSKFFQLIAQPEKGAAIPDANSYVTASAVKAYADSRGILLPGVSQDAIERAAVSATEAVEQRFAHEYAGDVRHTPGLHWPRGLGYDRNIDVYEFHGVPQVLREVVCRCAIRLAQGGTLTEEFWRGVREVLRDAGLIGFAAVAAAS